MLALIRAECGLANAQVENSPVIHAEEFLGKEIRDVGAGALSPHASATASRFL